MENLRGWLEFAFVVLQALVVGTWFLSAKLERRGSPRPKDAHPDDALLIQSEQLRQERAKHVQEQFDRIWGEIRDLHSNASDHMGDLQAKIGRQTERLAAIEAVAKENERRIAVLERVVLTYEKD